MIRDTLMSLGVVLGCLAATWTAALALVAIARLAGIR
jgi:hypothetical protein